MTARFSGRNVMAFVETLRTGGLWPPLQRTGSWTRHSFIPRIQTETLPARAFTTTMPRAYILVPREALIQ